MPAGHEDRVRRVLEADSAGGVDRVLFGVLFELAFSFAVKAFCVVVVALLVIVAAFELVFLF